MKKLLAAALCLCFTFGGCAPNALPTEESPAPSSPPTQTALLEKLALSSAKLPELPEAPDEASFQEALNALDAENLGQDDYQAAYDRLWSSYSARQEAYRTAVDVLRGEGLDKMLTGNLAAYTFRTTKQFVGNETEKNVVWSPANLYIALSMLTEITDGQSRAQLLTLLGLPDIDQARAAANAIWRNLYRDDSESKTLLANSVWLGEQFECHEVALERLANDYYASTFRAPMGDRTTDEAIHAWVNENTNHLLENAANALKTDANTLMMLISTLYFKGTWSESFRKDLTNQDTFTTASGLEQPIDFMHRIENGTYYRSGNFTVASLPFRDGMSMWFLLPDEGVRVNDALSLAWNLPMLYVDTSEGCYELPAFDQIAQESYGEIHWSVPKFDVNSDLDLIPALKALGVTDVFDERADFSPLTDADALVSAVEHAARVRVDEEGCEAAAFTAITMETTAARPDSLPIVEMNLNRPFGFLITGVDGLPLFMGLVNTTEPSSR